MQQECDIIRLGVDGRCRRLRGCRQKIKAERPGCRILVVTDLQLQHKDPQALGYLSRRRLAALLHDQGFRSQVRKIEFEFLGPVGGIERCSRRPRGDRDEGRRHLGTIRQDDGDTVITAHAQAIERLHRGLDQETKFAVAKRSDRRSSDGWRGGSAGAQQLRDRRDI